VTCVDAFCEQLNAYGPIRENVTSSTKPEVHKTGWHCRQRRTEPRPQFISITTSRGTVSIRRRLHRQNISGTRSAYRPSHMTIQPYRNTYMNLSRRDTTRRYRKKTYYQYSVLTNLAKWNSLSFPGFPDPLNSLFHTIITLKPDVTNHRKFGHFQRRSPPNNINANNSTVTYLTVNCNFSLRWVMNVNVGVLPQFHHLKVLCPQKSSRQFTGTTVATHVHIGLLWVSDCVTETYHLIFKNVQSMFQISLSFPWVFQN